jgi:polyisoprenoid-binding protein YceI
MPPATVIRPATRFWYNGSQSSPFSTHRISIMPLRSAIVSFSFAFSFASAALASTLFAAPAQAADYTQAPGSTLSFSGKYQGDTFNGSFPGFVAKFSFDPKQLATSKLDVTIPLANATTRNSDYDGELHGVSFFNSRKFPQARYTANAFRSLGGNRYAADGTLSLRGVSKPVTLTFTWTPGAKPVLNGTAVVKRLEFGVGSGDWADTSVIPNDIKVTTKVVFSVAARPVTPARK